MIAQKKDAANESRLIGFSKNISTSAAMATTSRDHGNDPPDDGRVQLLADPPAIPREAADEGVME